MRCTWLHGRLDLPLLPLLKGWSSTSHNECELCAQGSSVAVKRVLALDRVEGDSVSRLQRFCEEVPRTPMYLSCSKITRGWSVRGHHVTGSTAASLLSMPVTPGHTSPLCRRCLL